jgi:hypothetical protein
MAYTAFDPTEPDPSTQNITEFGQSVQDNQAALRDAVVGGTMAGWAMTPSGGTAEQPAVITYAKSTERVKIDLTWGSSGGADGNVTQAVFSYSSNSGTDYDTMGTETISYDTAGNPTGTSWS